MSNKLRLNLKIKIFISLLGSLVLMIVAQILSNNSIKRIVPANEWVIHTEEVINGMDRVMSHLTIIENSARGYAISGDPSFLSTLDQYNQKIHKQLDDLEKITHDNKRQQHRIRKLKTFFSSDFNVGIEIIAIRNTEGMNAALAWIETGQGKNLIQEVNGIAGDIISKEKDLLKTRIEATETTAGTILIINYISMVLSLLIALFFFLHIYREINKRIQSEKILTESERKYRKLVETMSDGVVYVDKALKILFVNNRFCEMMGYKKDELIGQSSLILLNNQHNDFHKKMEEREKGKAEQYELQLKKKNGEPLWAIINASPIYNEKDEVIGSMGTHTDITERKRIEEIRIISEEKYRTIFENSQSLICIHDLEGKILDINNVGAAVLGYQISEMVGMNMKDLIADSTKHEFSNYLKEIFTKGISEGTLKVKHKNGQHRIWYYKNILQEYNHHETHVLGNALDITERYLAEKELKKAKLLAEESAAAKENFLANISHEIKAPMDTVIGFTDLLQKTNLDKEQTEYVKAINASGKNLLSIINDILDISKIEAGKIELEEQPLDVKSILSAIIHMLKPKAEEHHTTLTANIDDRIPVTVMGDQIRLKQVIGNILGNAVKFTEGGSIELNALIKEDQDDVITIEFGVKDTGIGIPANKIEQVFERFSQTTSETIRKYGGPGLGLSIAKRLVELQGGKIYIESKLNKGTLVTCIIPFKKVKKKV